MGCRSVTGRDEADSNLNAIQQCCSFEYVTVEEMYLVVKNGQDSEQRTDGVGSTSTNSTWLEHPQPLVTMGSGGGGGGGFNTCHISLFTRLCQYHNFVHNSELVRGAFFFFFLS